MTAKGTQLNFGNKRREERHPLNDYANISLVPKVPSLSRHEKRHSYTQRET